jgi:hypothetical protein
LLIIMSCVETMIALRSSGFCSVYEARRGSKIDTGQPASQPEPVC